MPPSSAAIAAIVQQRADILTLAAQNLRSEEIALALDLDPRTVHRVRKAAGVAAPPGRPRKLPNSPFRAAQADSSWYSNPSAGRHYHIVRGIGSACGLPMLNEETECPPESVATILRCGRRGCVAHWPTVTKAEHAPMTALAPQDKG